VVVVTVREEDDAGGIVVVPALLDHLGRLVETGSDVGRRAGGEGLHGEPGRGLAAPRHARRGDDPPRVAGEGDDAEAVAGAEAVDDEPHGALRLLQLGPRHAPADVDHRDEVQIRRLLARQRGRLDLHHHREAVVRLVVRDRRVLALHAS